MKVYYRILEVNENEHSFVVRYYTDKLTENILATDLNIDGSIRRTKEGYPTRCRTDYNIAFFEHNVPTEEDIKKKIDQSAPIEWFKLKENILDPNVETSLSSLKSIPQVGEVSEPVKLVSSAKILSDEEIDNLLSELTDKK